MVHASTGHINPGHEHAQESPAGRSSPARNVNTLLEIASHTVMSTVSQKEKPNLSLMAQLAVAVVHVHVRSGHVSSEKKKKKKRTTWLTHKWIT